MQYNVFIALGNDAIQSQLLPLGEYIIGRDPTSNIVLHDASVSGRHAKLILTADAVWIEDLNSRNGTLVNSQPIKFPVRVTPTTILTIGVASLRVAPHDLVQAEKPQQAAHPVSRPTPQENAPSVVTTPSVPVAPQPDPQSLRREKALFDIKSQIHECLIQRLDLKRMTSTGTSNEILERRVREMLATIIEEIKTSGKFPPFVNPDQLSEEIYNEAMRLGPIERFLEDDAITEIMINGPRQVYVERNGKLTLTDQTFMDDESVRAVIERIVAPLGRRIDESSPYVDARLADGSRVNAVIPPLSLIGPCVTIRKFSKRALTEEDFIRLGTWTESAVEFLKVCVKLRKNIIVSGGTGSGKTTLLNVLSAFIPETDRILTIEDAAELRLKQPHVVRLEARPPNIEGRGAVTIRDLVRNALRMRPDRIIVGECRGGEAIDMLQAMNTGHDGSLTTVHANSARDVISRLETMVLMSGMDLPSRAIREQIASAVDIIVQESRMSDGSRKVVSITEVGGMEGTQITMQELFAFTQEGVDAHGHVIGNFSAVGNLPTFFESLSSRGIELSPTIFTPTHATHEGDASDRRML